MRAFSSSLHPIHSQSLTRPPLLRTLSSLASTATVPAMKVGQTLSGARWNYRLTKPLEEGLRQSKTFKAQVLPRDGSDGPAKWAVIKTAPADNKAARESLKREYDTYRISSIASHPCFRAMYDIIGDPKNLDDDAADSPPCLVLEWMDCTLAQVPSKRHLQDHILIKAIIDAVLSSLVTLDKEKLVNTDIKTDNILLSNVDKDHPVVKIGDLGLVRPDGRWYHAQPFAMRAPEVYRGLACVHRSQVWALAATLLCWIKPGVLGTAGSPGSLYREGWCIAKLMRLFPGWTGPPIEDAVRQSEFKLGKALIEGSEPAITDVLSLEDEMQTMGILPEMMGLLRRLLVVDPGDRPSAAEVLASEEYRNLK